MLVCLTAHQRSTPFDSLERLSTVGDDLAERLSGVHDSVRGAVVLATCNRFEAYFDLAEDRDLASPIPAMDAAMEAISAAADMPYRDLRENVDFAHGNQVAHHLFTVASGLDSVAVGEDEIAGQVRRALEAARERGLTTAPLEHLFQRATETSRTVKNTTRLGESGRSLVRLAVDLVTPRLDDWASARVLLVGTGRYAAAALAALRAVGAQDIRVHSRSGRQKFANREHLVHVAREDYAAEAAIADVIVTCTATTDVFALDGAAHAEARGGRTVPQVVIDLGLPRNVDPEVALLPGVDLLDLETIRLHAPVDEAATVGHAREIVQAAAQRHAAARRVHEVAPSVVDLRHFVQGLLDEELTRARRRGDSPEVETALRHFSGVVMHHLIARGHTLASSGAGAAWADAVRTVLPGSSPTTSPDEGEQS
ncbi:glutamyl-tRNA reductase [Microbacterium sp. EYE_5]|uniref:glutamyl-tRNA reductase n=1 Tax=unclassified Microbacterium TaxID=2609290 RepID=UPI00200383F0|nr:MULTISPECIES: glutamyl-tRNA reductase [unclassified Microbacterium]MCK6081154.1 glutamyl-tRNA reductase [Microbacterium sp. EYE_382]MCK6086424.1 glutamyl-tRNA reductase [Microbacterium sp. EYE_384]MCK6124078.1 glutamyl-tRNA reductase [Microbacterium sp. EYE_80]MCK6126987.1 glutamyl-tRNA reductase [Microbacterium sp. EYE_79]MCK6142109.1 glutamyl-tRNA reductase [Microbacterium sp. EYE_39]